MLVYGLGQKQRKANTAFSVVWKIPVQGQPGLPRAVRRARFSWRREGLSSIAPIRLRRRLLKLDEELRAHTAAGFWTTSGKLDLFRADALALRNNRQRSAFKIAARD